MIYELVLSDKSMDVEADDVELTGVAAGSAGFFRFYRDGKTVFAVSAKLVLEINRVAAARKRE